FMVHFEASKHGIVGMDKSELTSGRKLLVRQGYLLIPLFVLLYYLVYVRVSVNNSAFFSIVVLLVLAAFVQRFKENLTRTLLIAIGLIAIIVLFQFLISPLNEGLHHLNDIFGMNFFSVETIRWKPEILVLSMISLGIALIFSLFQRRMKIDQTGPSFGWKQAFAGFETA